MEDSHYSVNLFRSSYASTFGLVVFSKQLDALAWAATVVRLDEEEAPRREIERQKKQQEDSRAAQEKARLVNKATFRPLNSGMPQVSLVETVVVPRTVSTAFRGSLE